MSRLDWCCWNILDDVIIWPILSLKDFLNKKIDAQSVLIKSWMWYSLHLKINTNNIIGKCHKTFVFRLLHWTPPLQESCSDPGLLHKSRPTSVRSGILTVSSHLHLMSASNFYIWSKEIDPWRLRDNRYRFTRLRMPYSISITFLRPALSSPICIKMLL